MTFHYGKFLKVITKSSIALRSLHGRDRHFLLPALASEPQTNTWRSCGYLRRLGSRCGIRHHVRTGIPKKSVHLCEAGSIVVPTRLQALAVALVRLLLGSVRHGSSRRGR